jgi:hypothetical protein
VVTKAKKSIAQFKLRAGMAIGTTVTLRGERMFEFCDRLYNIALPRIRDFTGVPARAFDGRGNYTLGLREQLAFPEIEYDKVDKIRGMEITFVTTARTTPGTAAARELLGMPFGSERRDASLNRRGYGEKGGRGQGDASGEVCGSGPPPLQVVWPATGLHSEVWHVPHLLPGVGLGGQVAGRRQGELVEVRRRA